MQVLKLDKGTTLKTYTFIYYETLSNFKYLDVAKVCELVPSIIGFIPFCCNNQMFPITVYELHISF